MKNHLLILLCFLFSSPLLAQIHISGTVIDESKQPIGYATVRIKGDKKLVSTEMDGKFKLTAPDKNSVLEVSYMGYEKFSQKIGDRKIFNIELKPSGNTLGETVIVGYAKQKKINATGAVKTIGNDILENRPLANAVQGLQGAVAGFNITNDMGGAPGQGMNINIRGIGSIGEGSNSSPLILIDGMEGDLSTINPNDIENISVLKDGASASIYGSRAPFGVVLVTTKKGRKGFRANYSTNVRFMQPISQPDMVDGYTYALMMNDAYINSGGNAPFGSAQLQRIQDYMNGKLRYGTMPWTGKNKWMEYQSCFGSTDWYDWYLKNVTTSHEHNLNINGAAKGFNYYFSANYLGQTGLFNYADEKYSRLALNGKIGYQLGDKLTFNWSTRYVYTDNSKPSALNELFYHNLGRRAAVAVIDMPNGDYSAESMMESLTHGGRQSDKVNQLYNQASIVYEPIKNWKLHGEVNSRIEHNPYDRNFNPIFWHLPDGSLEYLQVFEGVSAEHKIRPNGQFQVNPAAGETYREHARTDINYFSTNFYTDYTLSLNDAHNFTFLLGEQSEYFHREINRNAVTDADLGQSEGLGTLQSWKEGEWASLGFFGRVNYNFKDRYMVEFNLRADGASRFPKNQKWGCFPSASIGWNIAEEKFWRPLRDKGLDYLKIRASWANSGNQNTKSFYPYYQEMNLYPGDAFINGQQVTVLPMYAPFSNKLTWERIENIGAGLEWGFFKNRLQGSFDYYQRKTKDMVGPANALSALYGDKAPKTNNAELRTRGWELECSWQDHIGPDFSYKISATISDYNTVITKYDSPDNKITGWYKGKHVGDIWGFNVLGVAKSDAEMYEHLSHHSQSSIGNKWGGGDVMYNDLNNDGKVDKGSETLDNHGDLRVIGNSTPHYAYSFTFETKWKFIDVRAFFQGVGKRDFFFTKSSTFFGIASEWQRSLFTDHLDYFRYAGSDLGANYENPYYARLRIDENNIQVSDKYLQDASYLRLKNVQIGFSLPENTKLSRWIKKGRIYISGENLLTWTKLRIFDPEALGDFENWGPGKTYPQYRTFSVGLDLTF